MIGIGNSNDKKLQVNKSGALNLIKKAENSKNKEKIISNTFSNYNLLNNNKNNSKKKSQNICSSFRQNNNSLGIKGNKLQNTISFGNSNVIKANMSGTYIIKKSGNNNDNINFSHHNNILTSTNMTLL